MILSANSEVKSRSHIKDRLSCLAGPEQPLAGFRWELAPPWNSKAMNIFLVRILESKYLPALPLVHENGGLASVWGCVFVSVIINFDLAM